jgi:putative transposon-encoded protein
MEKRKSMNKDNKNIATKRNNGGKDGSAEAVKDKVKFEIFGEEMIEKTVKLSGNSGRVYLPPTWVGHTVKIIRID